MLPASRVLKQARRPAVHFSASLNFPLLGSLGSTPFVNSTTFYNTPYLNLSVPERVQVDDSYKESLPHVPLNFNDAQIAFASKSSFDIVRTWAVLTVCQIEPLVENADKLLVWSKQTFGSWIVNFVIKRTFFKHFCAGENQAEITPVLRKLRSHGIGGILDYAAEDDVKAEEGPASRSKLHDTVVARTFEYENEAKCDNHTGTFLKNIQAASDAPGQGFAAIKVTALGNPKLLERVSNGVLAIQSLFQQFDSDGNNQITRDEFEQVYNTLFDDATPARINQIFEWLDEDKTGIIDYLEWSRRLQLDVVPELAKHCRVHGPLFQSVLSTEELRQLRRMMRRLHDLADAAKKLNVKLMVDAEHSYFQPAIDHAVQQLQLKHNQESAVIYNTYQCYLKDTETRIQIDMDRAKREGYHFAAKLVRGAYMFLERDRAKAKGYPSPIWDCIEETHLCYNRNVKSVIQRVKEEGAEVMVASHNQYSVETAVAEMHALGLDPEKSHVYFGQLLGMSDNLSYVLGSDKYRAYKYVPWGRVDEVMPYLIRRAQENSTVIGGVQNEKDMLLTELWRRFNPFSRSTPQRVESAAYSGK